MDTTEYILHLLTQPCTPDNMLKLVFVLEI